MSDVYIHAVGDYCERCEDGVDVDFKPLVAEAVGQSVRRVGRFIQLALIGAGRCARATKLPSDTGVYFGSARGDLEITIEVMQALLRDGHAPKPLSFINTVSNAACFYVAQSLRLQGRSSFVCNRYFSFETVLQLAAIDLHARSISAALVGTVDVVVPPLGDHRKRLGLAADAAVADASHWLCLRSDSANALARLVAIEIFAESESLRAWLRVQTFGERCLVSGGQFIDDDEIDRIAQHYAFGGRFDYRRSRAYYDSQSGAALGEFLRGSTSHSQLLHINRDPSGRYYAMRVERSN